MNEFVLDILLYLFENFSPSNIGANSELRRDLDNAGFLPDEIDNAFDWLHATQARVETVTPPQPDTLRLYSDSEQRVLDTECRGYITGLEHAGVLCGGTRELVIDRLMALADDDFEAIRIEQIRWVVRMVLFSADDETPTQARMQPMFHAEVPEVHH